MEDFNRELTPGNTKAAMKAVGAEFIKPWGSYSMAPIIRATE